MNQGTPAGIWEHAGPRPGSWLLGKWRLDRLLGRGGMSSVYAATHRNGNQVAIKILHPELACDARLRQRFLREGYIANRVDHPDAVRVLDDGVDGPSAFLVMDLLRGQDLESLRSERGGALPPGEVVWLAVRILEILGAAHAAKIVHRDIKPQNLFVTVDGCAKLLDFGVASLRGVPGFTTLTEAAVLPGTPGYMAPEQVQGHQHALGPHTDLWGLGATLFRLLTGESIYLARTPGEMMVATATQPARSVRAVRSGIPPSLAQVVERALASDPSARWPSADAMRSALVPLQLSGAVRVAPIAAQSSSDTTWDASQPSLGEQLRVALAEQPAAAFDDAAAPQTLQRVTSTSNRSTRRVLAVSLTVPLVAAGLWAALSAPEQRGRTAWRAAGPPSAPSHWATAPTEPPLPSGRIATPPLPSGRIATPPLPSGRMATSALPSGRIATPPLPSGRVATSALPSASARPVQVSAEAPPAAPSTTAPPGAAAPQRSSAAAAITRSQPRRPSDSTEAVSQLAPAPAVGPAPHGASLGSGIPAAGTGAAETPLQAGARDLLRRRH